jgi:cardiolipin synthase
LARHLPNLISLARICIVPFALRSIWLREYEWALLWISIAGASDFLDGFLARRLKAASPAGAYLDPIADKLLLSGAYLVLGCDRVIPLWLTAVVFGRDALMLLFIGLALLNTRLRRFPPTVWGKLSTAVQIATALYLLLNAVWYFGPYARPLRGFLIGLTAAATAWSAIDYLRIGLKMLRSPHPPSTA